MTDTIPQAAASIEEKVKEETPGIVAHLEAFVAWDKAELLKAKAWIESKL